MEEYKIATKEELLKAAERQRELADAFKAAAEGTAVQWYNDIKKVWEDIDLSKELTYIEQHIPLRIKPENKYRAYKDVAEFLAAQEEHGQRIKVVYDNNEKWCLPQDLEMSLGHLMIHFLSNVWDSPTSGGYSSVSAEVLLNSKYFRWQDGTICGVLDKE